MTTNNSEPVAHILKEDIEFLAKARKDGVGLAHCCAFAKSVRNGIGESVAVYTTPPQQQEQSGEDFEAWFKRRFGKQADYVVAKPFIREAWEAALSPSPAKSPDTPAGSSGEVIYQWRVQFGDWKDVTKEQYDLVKPELRRIVYQVLSNKSGIEGDERE
jgi:hypothetical protein